MTKKLLMLGGGFLQNYVIQKAKSMGYYVLCLDANPNALGFQIADEYAVIDIVDKEACLAYAREKQINGVLTAATDFSVLTTSYIAESMHLPGINYRSAKIIKNKASVRKLLFDAHADDTGCSYEIESVEQITDILSKIKFPVMIKPVDGSGSRGASKVEKVEDITKAVEFAMSGSLSHHAVIEPFIDGREYGVESFVDEGQIHVLAIMQKDMTLPPYYAELGHAIPSGLSDELERKIRNCVYRTICALGINFGSVNMDLLLTQEGNVHIVDIGARMGGNLIGSHIIPQGTGIDYMANMIHAAVGDSTYWKPKWQPRPVATKLLALQPGKVKELPDIDAISVKYNVQIEHHLHKGDIITSYHTNLDGCGYVIASSFDVNSSIALAAEVRKVIDESIIRE